MNRGGTSPLDQAIPWAASNGANWHRRLSISTWRPRQGVHGGAASTTVPMSPRHWPCWRQQGSGPRMWLLLWGRRLRQMG